MSATGASGDVGTDPTIDGYIQAVFSVTSPTPKPSVRWTVCIANSMDLNFSAASSLNEEMEETLTVHKLRVPDQLRSGGLVLAAAAAGD